MSTFFWDWEGVIHIYFLQERRMINAGYYSNISLGKVNAKIWPKRKIGGNLISFLQDNARPHTYRKTMETTRKLKWDLLPHPPYSPDIIPSNFFLFGRTKSDLEGVWFKDNNAVISYVQQWIHTQPKNIWERGIKQLPKH